MAEMKLAAVGHAQSGFREGALDIRLAEKITTIRRRRSGLRAFAGKESCFCSSQFAQNSTGGHGVESSLSAWACSFGVLVDQEGRPRLFALQRSC